MPQLLADCAGMGGNDTPLIFSLLSPESNLDFIFPVAKLEVGCIWLLTKTVPCAFIKGKAAFDLCICMLN